MTIHTAEPVTTHSVPPAPAAGDLVEPRRRRFSRTEYRELAREGWFRGRRALLLDGEIYEMAAQGNWHVVVLELVMRQLRKIFSEDQFWIRSQNPIDLPDESSDPEPDVAVVPGTPRGFDAHPSTSLLIVEVADSSLQLDRRKAHAYAAAGIADYWIVNIRAGQVEVYRQPVKDVDAPLGHRYERVEVLAPGKVIQPLAAPQATVAVADLLPKQPVLNPDT